MMPVIIDTRVPRHTGLNRTFYGIETGVLLNHAQQFRVLIVPFMELKRLFLGLLQIEVEVLIVPFMELKQPHQ